MSDLASEHKTRNMPSRKTTANQNAVDAQLLAAQTRRYKDRAKFAADNASCWSQGASAFAAKVHEYSKASVQAAKLAIRAKRQAIKAMVEAQIAAGYASAARSKSGAIQNTPASQAFAEQAASDAIDAGLWAARANFDANKAVLEAF